MTCKVRIVDRSPNELLLKLTEVGVLAYAEILTVGNSDHSDADVCFATGEVTISLDREHLEDLLIETAMYFMERHGLKVE